MTDTLASARRYTALQFDSRAAILVSLFAVVIGGALAVRPALVATQGVESAVTGASTGEQAGIGVVWAIAEAIFAGLLLAGVLLWRRLPGWVRNIGRDLLTIAVWMTVGAWALANRQFHLALPVVLGLFAIAKAADEYDIWWLINNALAIGLAIYLAAFVGVILGPVVIAVGLVGLAVYDHVFANERDWMLNLAVWTIQRKLPMLVVVPNRWRQSWDDLAEEPEDMAEREDVFAIGMADLLLPAAFAVALAQTGRIGALSGAVVGTGIACFRLSWVSANGPKRGGAGLPSLTVGAVTGAVIGMGVA